MGADFAAMGTARLAESPPERSAVRPDDAVVEDGAVGIVHGRQCQPVRPHDEIGVRGGVGRIAPLAEKTFAEVVDGVIRTTEEVERPLRRENAERLRVIRRRGEPP